MNSFSLSEVLDAEIGHEGFISVNEQAELKRFLDAGYLIQSVESLPDLDRIRKLVCFAVRTAIRIDKPVTDDQLLNYVHHFIKPDQLNELRLQVITTINANEWVRPAYFRLARRALELIVGNELAMQLRVNLSIQMPEDHSSLLPIHADTWSGDSPFEMVVWLPLVDCHSTKSMFLLPPAACENPAKILIDTSVQDSEALFQAVESNLVWLNVNYGQIVLFNQNLPHGNRVNLESETRWTMNCRFKGVFTPYADKRLGEFFEPITLRPASRIGLEYRIAEMQHNQGG